MVANNQYANKFKGKKKELNFDSILKQLLSMSKDSPAIHNSQSLKTSIPKSKDKSKSHSNKTCSYSTESGHNNHSCYHKYPEKWRDSFWKKHKDKIAKLKYDAAQKNSKKKAGTFGNCNAWRFIIHNIAVHTTSSPKEDKWYFNNAVFFHMTCDLANFEDEELMQSHKNNTI